MLGFVGGDFGFVFQRQPDVVEPFEQAVTGELVNPEAGRESVVIVDFSPLQVDGEMVVMVLRCPANDLLDFSFGQHHREHAILYAVVGKDIGER